MITKLKAYIAIAFGFLLLLLKLKDNKIERLEDQNEAHEIKDDIEQSQKAHKDKVLKDEKPTIEKAVEKADSLSDVDFLNGL